MPRLRACVEQMNNIATPSAIGVRLHNTVYNTHAITPSGHAVTIQWVADRRWQAVWRAFDDVRWTTTLDGRRRMLLMIPSRVLQFWTAMRLLLAGHVELFAREGEIEGAPDRFFIVTGIATGEPRAWLS